ncbi:M56 family metallopeptidase [Paenibacillus arenilitoris]|uniref:M56 family metallopeptidase n=1 Tax=Paenibacillus arenilitoris TaxID=2772299 RepID=A0A927CUN6_9BACL|nr:M56 family metallopeptidase [Paenibacillus arenilitoris]MBD2871885.1 M56 family metallopeptidase [Paenibacillus arenilitoris]
MLILYYSILLMSVVTSTLHVGLWLLEKWTRTYFSAKWHYVSYILVYTFFIFPYFKAITFLSERFSIQSNVHSMVVPIQAAVQEATEVSKPRTEDISSVPNQSTYVLQADWHILNVIPYLFLTGTIIFLIVAFIRNFKIHHRMTSVCEQTYDLNLILDLEASKQKLGIKRNVAVYFAPYVSSPFLYGVIRPRIVLPAGIEFTTDEYRQIFLHELTHYKRYDIWIKLFLIIVNALHWFNPLAYKARRDIDRYCELSCDEQLVRSMNLTERKQYCELLLSVLWNVTDQKTQVYTAFSDKGTYLERRISMILNNKGAKRKSIQLLSGVVTLFIILGGSAAVYAGSINAKSVTELNDSKPGVVLLSEIKKEGNIELAVEKAASREYLTAYKEIHPGESKGFGGYALKKGDSLTPTFSSAGGELKVYLLEYDDQALEDGELLNSNSKHNLVESGNYYFVLVNEGHTSSTNVELAVQLQVN